MTRPSASEVFLSRERRPPPHRRSWRVARAARSAACFALVARFAAAEVSLDERHADGYYLARAGAVMAAAGLTVATTAIVSPARPEPTAEEWLGLDNGTRGLLSPSVATASDVSLFAAMALPFGAELGGGFDSRLANTSLLYTEVLSANVLLNTVVKYSVPRLRPYTYRVPAPSAYIASQGVDAYLSFYSGHASTAFAAATGGSFLFAAAHPNSDARPWLWGSEMALATATAIWRVRAGKHFPSDVAIGVVIGSAIGLGIPLLEGVRYRPGATEMAFAAGGTIVGGVTAIALPFHDEIAIPLHAPSMRVQILPSIGARSAGIAMNGRF